MPDISSSLDDPREHAETIQSDHRNMAKFRGRDDPNYAKMRGELKRIMSLLSDGVPTPNLSDQEQGTSAHCMYFGPPAWLIDCWNQAA